MTPITVTATRLTDGTDVLLDRLTELTVTNSLASPAGAMSCTAAVDAFPGELGGVAVRQGGRTLFTGSVDQQAASLSGAGRTLTLDARTRGALLLDNEAMPCVLSNARLSTVFGLFCAPYGFRLDMPAVDRLLAMYTVHKSLSEWEALCGFVRRVYGRSPHLRDGRISVEAPRSVGMVTVGEGGHPFSRLEQTVTPYHIVSKVVLRDADGAYSSAVHNSAAAYYGVQRKRYVIPANEFTDSPGLDANQRIRRSMLEKERVNVTLPGILEITPGQEVRVNSSISAGGPDLTGLLAQEVTWRAGPGGIQTDLELLQSMYYE